MVKPSLDVNFERAIACLTLSEFDIKLTEKGWDFSAALVYRDQILTCATKG